MNLKYYLGLVLSIPLLPILLLQGKRIRKKVPKLPEAREPKGLVKMPSKSTLKVLAIGESTIAGVGVDFHENGFIGSLAKEMAKQKNSRVLWSVYAKSGYTAKLVRKKIIPKIEETNADLILVGLGGNDAFVLNSPKVWVHQIELLIQTLKEKFPKTPIYFTNMPPIKEFPAFTKAIKFTVGNLVEILGENLQKVISNKNNVHYNSEVVTLEQWTKRYGLKGATSDFFSDGVHPSKLTYQIWGKDMANFILKTEHEKQGS